MKKIILLFLIWGFPVFGQSSFPLICEGSGVRAITVIDQKDTTIIKELNNYKNYLRGDRYEFCFIYSAADVNKRWTRINSVPLQVPLTADKPVVISGLDLRRDKDSSDKISPLFLTDGAEVILHNSKFTCAPNSKTPSPQPSPTGGEGVSIGIKLLGDAHEIIGSEIKNCGIGIQIGDATTAGNNNQITETKIHDNGIGIKVANGQGNFFKKDSVYKNDANNNAEYLQKEGIELESGANGNILSPPILNTSGQIAKEDDPVLLYSNNVATFYIKPPYPEGIIEVSLVGSQRDSGNSSQGRTFLAEAQCISTATSYACAIPMTGIEKDQLAVILFHHPTFGTTTYSVRVKLNGTGILSAADTGSAGVTGGDGTQLASAGGIMSEPASAPAPAPAPPSVPSEEDKDDGGNSIGVATPAGETTAGVISGGVASTGAPGGVKGGCGAELLRREPKAEIVTSDAAMWILFLSLTICILLLPRNKISEKKSILRTKKKTP